MIGNETASRAMAVFLYSSGASVVLV